MYAYMYVHMYLHIWVCASVTDLKQFFAMQLTTNKCNSI